MGALKHPWRKHYTRDWRTDPFVRSLDLETRCFYQELLDICWDEGGLREEWLDGTFLAGELRISRRLFRTLWAKVQHKFEQLSPGFRSNFRLENERKSDRKEVENGRKGAEARWSKRKTLSANRWHSESESESESESDKKLLSKSVERFDFEAAYAEYPRHEGKAAGMKTLKREIKTREQYDDFRKANANYTKSRIGQEPQYTLLWSTFCNGRWLDYVNPAPSMLKARASPRVGPEKPMEHVEKTEDWTDRL